MGTLQFLQDGDFTLRNIAFAIAAFAAATVVTPVAADIQRIGATGGAVMTVDLPADWHARRDAQAPNDIVAATAPDDSAMLQVAVLVDSSHTPIDQLAAAYVSQARARVVGAATPAQLGRHGGSHWRLELRRADGALSGNADLTFAQIGPDRIGMVFLGTRVNASPAQRAAAGAVARTVRVSP